MNEIPVKPWWQSWTLWFNAAVVVAEVLLKQQAELQATIPLGGSAFWSLLAAVLGNAFIRLYLTRQPITVAAAVRPMTGTVIQVDHEQYTKDAPPVVRYVIKRNGSNGSNA